MKPLALLILVSVLVFASLPARAQSQDEKSLDLTEILTEGSRALTKAIQHGLAVIQDHIEINADAKSHSKDENSAQLRLRLFPKGKSQSNQQLGADTTLDYSLNPEHPRFNFGLRIIPLKPDRNPDDYV
jgi:hypothetical protein